MKTKPDAGDTAGPAPADHAARGGDDSDLVKRLAEKIMDEDREVLRALADVMNRRRSALRDLAK